MFKIDLSPYINDKLIQIESDITDLEDYLKSVTNYLDSNKLELVKKSSSDVINKNLKDLILFFYETVGYPKYAFNNFKKTIRTRGMLVDEKKLYVADPKPNVTLDNNFYVTNVNLDIFASKEINKIDFLNKISAEDLYDYYTKDITFVFENDYLKAYYVYYFYPKWYFNDIFEKDPEYVKKGVRINKLKSSKEEFIKYCNEAYYFSSRAYCSMYLKLNKKPFDYIQEILKIKPENFGETVLTVLTGFYKKYSVPKVFSEDNLQGKNVGKDIKEGTYLNNGELFYIPDVKYRNNKKLLKDWIIIQSLYRKENRTEKEQALLNEKLKKVRNGIIGFDLKTNTFTYISYGELRELDLKLQPINSEENIVNLIEKRVSTLLQNKFYETSLVNDKKVASKVREYIEKDEPLSSYIDDPDFYDSFLSFKKECLDNLYKGEISVSPLSAILALGFADFIVKNAKKYKKIKENIKTRKEKFYTATAKECPPLPSLDPDTIMFPHQAESLAKLKHAPSSAIIDVGTGGGKTFIILADILNLMKEGKIKRPLIVVPLSLTGQWVSEIISFTNGKINPIVINTETVKSWGEDKIRDLCKNAPPNTIFITAYNYLSLHVEYVDENPENAIFPNINFIEDCVNPDYIALDESHYIKNTKSLRSIAIRRLGSLNNIKTKRIATGTLVYNNPQDLLGQLMFLDPTIYSSEKEFYEKYAERVTRSGKVIEWKQNASELIRNDLSEKTYYLKYTEKDWAHLLPKLEFNYHTVELTENQYNVYYGLVNEIMVEIKEDAKLKKMWDNLTSIIDEEEDVNIPSALLGKFITLEQFINFPGLTRTLRDSEDAKSPKIDKIDEIISKSKGKVIVAFHTKVSARAFQTMSKFSNQCIYYDAENKQNMETFLTSKNIKVMSAVIQSMTEGFNLQAVERIIIADVDWTPGALKQLIARIFRPHLKKENGQFKNLNSNKTVYIDYVLCKGTIDILKFCLQTWKKCFNAAVIEGYDDLAVPPKPPINEDMLISADLLNFEAYTEADTDYRVWRDSLIEENKKNPNLNVFYKVKSAGDIKGKTIDIPWVSNMILPDMENSKTLVSFIEENNGDPDDYRTVKKQLLGKTVRTDRGIGKVVSVMKKTLKVKLSDNTVIVVPNAYLVEKQKIEVKKVVKKEKKIKTKTLPDNKVTVNLYLYNGIPCIGAFLEDDKDNEELFKLGFKFLPNIYVREINSKIGGKRILTRIEKKYQINKECKEMIEKCINSLNKRGLIQGLKKISNLEIRNFLLLRHRVNKSGKIRLYPLIEDNRLLLVLNKKTHPGVNLTQFGFDLYDFCFLLCKTGNDIKRKLVEIVRKIGGIENIQDVMEDVKFLRKNKIIVNISEKDLQG